MQGGLRFLFPSFISQNSRPCLFCSIPVLAHSGWWYNLHDQASKFARPFAFSTFSGRVSTFVGCSAHGTPFFILAGRSVEKDDAGWSLLRHAHVCGMQRGECTSRCIYIVLVSVCFGAPLYSVSRMASLFVLHDHARRS